MHSETDTNSDTTLNVKDGPGWSTFCKDLGFLGLTTDWSGYLCLTWVIVYVLQ